MNRIRSTTRNNYSALADGTMGAQKSMLSLNLHFYEQVSVARMIRSVKDAFFTNLYGLRL